MPPGTGLASQPEGPQGVAPDQGGSTAHLVSVYFDELRALAAAHMRAERAGHTLQPTALAGEAFLRLSGQSGQAGAPGEIGGAGEGWKDKSHFLFAASVAIRRILVDHARARACLKRGGGSRREALNESSLEAPECDLIGLDRELEELGRVHPRPAAVVQMRFFGGLTESRIAAVLGVTERTIRKDWALARAWLHRRLRDQEA